MLVLSRMRDESILIGDDIEIAVVDIRGDKVRLGINAPKEISVHRKEVYQSIKRTGKLNPTLAPPGTIPIPISELHEDDGTVIVANWKDGRLEEYGLWGLLDTDFDISRWTHFYKMPNIQPPPQETKVTSPKGDGYVAGRGA